MFILSFFPVNPAASISNFTFCHQKQKHHLQQIWWMTIRNCLQTSSGHPSVPLQYGWTGVRLLSAGTHIGGPVTGNARTIFCTEQ